MASTARPSAILREAREESDELCGIIESKLVRRITDQVSGYVLRCDVASQTKAELQSELKILIRQIVDYDWIANKNAPVERWLVELRECTRQCRPDFGMTRYFAAMARDLYARMTERRLAVRMGALSSARDQALRTDRMAEQLADVSHDLAERIERNIDYLCSPEASDAAAFEEWEDMPELEEPGGPIVLEAEF
ncbi:hypothetical protein GSI_11303 [Ganoderma sinense ZZ0214-1]|uniref:Uncharacterized protein n=1 Tax=Ganoderma sinense ZZ0214-1 TaxID=1077348 RepID=A0A2G8RYK5_9APHY|nr:hypothetical protein GSI_11303 [Ganoderma sinense ZZ0214-1]